MKIMLNIMFAIFCCVRQHSKISASATVFITTPSRYANHRNQFRRLKEFSTLKSRNINEKIIDGLNESQKRAVTQAPNSIIRVVAGPGAGKTKVLTSRIAWLLHNTLPDAKKDKITGNIQSDECSENKSSHRYPPRILAVTFTKKAAGEMQTRLHDLLNELDNSDEISLSVHQSESDAVKINPVGMERVSLGTFHSICCKILRKYGDELQNLPYARGTNLNGRFTILDQSEQLRIVKNCMRRIGVISNGGEKENNALKPKQILSLISNMKSSDLRKDGFDSINEGASQSANRLQRAVKQIYPLYLDHLLENNSLDFDDLLLLTRDLLSLNSTVQAELQRRWEYILVDEFQDTSSVQLDLISKLVSKSLFVVGDQDQSIYSWRGASVEGMMMGMDQVFQRHTSIGSTIKTLYLMENYRSTQNIVKAAQKIISPLNYGSILDTKSQVIRKNMKPMRELGPSPRIIACADSEAEADKIITILQEMIETDKLNAQNGDTVAILYRTNAQSRVVEEACVRKNVRYLVRGNAGTFYTRREIQDCLCFMKVLYNSHDLPSFLRCAKTPSRGIGNVAMQEFMQYCKSNNLSLLDGLLSLSAEKSEYDSQSIMSKRALNNFRNFSTQFRTLRNSYQNMRVGDILNQVIDVFKLEDHFQSVSKTSEEFTDRMNNVNELKLASQRYDTNLGDFLDDVALLSDLDTSEPNEEKKNRRIQANLMTIHAAKGMEFDAVFMIGNEQGTFPSQRSLIEGQNSMELAEERRLCYVAMTRAKTYLTITWRKSVTYFSGQGISTRDGKRSQFINLLLSKKGKAKQRRSIDRKDLTFASNISSEGEDIPLKSAKKEKHIIRDVNDIEQALRSKVQGKKTVSQLRSSPSKHLMRQQSKHAKDSNISSYLTAIDSTLFYPVGSKVRHKTHGVGIVISPPSGLKSADYVRVKFETGLITELSVQGSRLRRET